MNFGAALAGYGQAQPAIQKLQQEQQQKAAMAQLFQALQQAKGQAGQQQAQGQPGQPGQPQGPSAGMPSLDVLMNTLASAPGDPAAKMQALEQYGAFITPFDKMTQQLEMKQKALDAASTNLDTKLQSMRDLQISRNQQSGANTMARTDTAVAGQDLGALEKEVSDQKAIVVGILNTPGGIDKPEYKQEKATYDSLRQQLDTARKTSSKPGAKAAAKPAEGTTAQPAQSDIDYLKANPDQAPNFDAEFGQGAAAKVLGQ